MTSSHHASASPSAGLLTGSLTDLRHAFRLLWKSKRITATTLVTLALCIGATTAIFSSVYSLMLKPLPFQEPERIMELYSSAVKAGLNHMPANVPFYLDYSQNASPWPSPFTRWLAAKLRLKDQTFIEVSDFRRVMRSAGVFARSESAVVVLLRPIVGILSA
jgi:hypothetical protein